MSDEPLITCEELKKLMDAGEKVVIIDLRGSGAYNHYHIKGAINIPYNAAGDPLEREMMLSTLPGDAWLVPYCD